MNVAQVGTISQGSAAEKSGLQVGDIIQQVDIVETGQTILISNYEDIYFTQENLKTTIANMKFINTPAKNIMTF